MEDLRMVRLALGKGESRRVLVEAGTTVLLVAGDLALRGPLVWLAENIVASEQRLRPEQSQVIETGGWIDLTAVQAAELVVLPPEEVQVWQKVARCFESLLGHEGGKQPAALP
jgi:hypothetical protein